MHFEIDKQLWPVPSSREEDVDGAVVGEQPTYGVMHDDPGGVAVGVVLGAQPNIFFE